MFVFRALFLVSAMCVIAIYELTLPIKYKVLAFIVGLPYLPVALVRAGFNRRRIMIVTVQHCGICFVKLGQLLAMRHGLVGEDIADRLKSLLADLPPVNNAEILKVLRRNFNGLHRFKYIKPIPIATASIAQVYKGTLNTGEDVAIKVLKPNVYKQFETDMSLAKMVAKMIDRRLPKLRSLKLVDMMREFEATISKEFMLIMEAASMDEFAEKMKGRLNGHVMPRVIWDMTTAEVLTMTWIDGENLSCASVGTLNSFSLDVREKLAEDFLNGFFEQTYGVGLFHADMHAGNIMLTTLGGVPKIALIDFGCTVLLQEKDRLYLASIFYAFVNRKYDYIAQLHNDAGYIDDSIDLRSFALSCRIIGEKFLQRPAGEINTSAMLDEFLQVIQRLGIKSQPSLLFFQRSMMLSESIAKLLNPNIDIWVVAKPWFAKWYSKNLTLDAVIKSKIKSFAGRVKKFAIDGNL